MQKLVTEKKIVLIDYIIPNEYNPNQMSDFIYGRMKETIKEKGLFGSIICRPLAGMYQILDGEHRWKACKELGYTELPIEVSVNEMSDQDVKFWTLYFNNTRGKDDIEKVAQIFNEIDIGQAQLLPFTEDEIENTKALFKFDFSQYENKDVEVPVDELPRVFSLSFTENEWIVLQEAFDHVKTQNKSNKQWFMLMLGEYLRKNGIRSGFEETITNNF